MRVVGALGVGGRGHEKDEKQAGKDEPEKLRSILKWVGRRDSGRRRSCIFDERWFTGRTLLLLCVIFFSFS
jgi:hypothetical protein